MLPHKSHGLNLDWHLYGHLCPEPADGSSSIKQLIQPEGPGEAAGAHSVDHLGIQDEG